MASIPSGMQHHWKRKHARSIGTICSRHIQAIHPSGTTRRTSMQKPCASLTCQLIKRAQHRRVPLHTATHNTSQGPHCTHTRKDTAHSLAQCVVPGCRPSAEQHGRPGTLCQHTATTRRCCGAWYHECKHARCWRILSTLRWVCSGVGRLTVTAMHQPHA